MNERIERNLAKQEGYFEGVEQKQKEIVLNMYNQKYKIEDIVSITNLTVEEVENIIQEEKNETQ